MDPQEGGCAGFFPRNSFPPELPSHRNARVGATGTLLGTDGTAGGTRPLCKIPNVYQPWDDGTPRFTPGWRNLGRKPMLCYEKEFNLLRPPRRAALGAGRSGLSGKMPSRDPHGRLGTAYGTAPVCKIPNVYRPWDVGRLIHSPGGGKEHIRVTRSGDRSSGFGFMPPASFTETQHFKGYQDFSRVFST